MNAQQWLADEYGEEFLLDTLSQEAWFTITHDILAPELFAHDRSLAGAAASRVVFTFDHTWHVTYTRHPANDTGRLTLWSPVSESTPPQSLTCAFQHPPGTASWILHTITPDDASTALHACVDTFGYPSQIILPWASIPLTPTVYELVEEWETETFTYLQHALLTLPPTTLRDLTEEADDYNVDPVTLLVWAVFRAQAAPLPNPWVPTPPIHLTSGLDLLPPQSPAQRFLTMLHVLEQQHGWVVLLDQCCGTCQIERYDHELHARKLPQNAPVITIWADTSHTLLQPDGSINITIPLDNSTHAQTLTALAEQHGLQVHRLDTTTITLT